MSRRHDWNDRAGGLVICDACNASWYGRGKTRECPGNYVDRRRDKAMADARKEAEALGTFFDALSAKHDAGQITPEQFGELGLQHLEKTILAAEARGAENALRTVAAEADRLCNVPGWANAWSAYQIGSWLRSIASHLAEEGVLDVERARAEKEENDA